MVVAAQDKIDRLAGKPRAQLAGVEQRLALRAPAQHGRMVDEEHAQEPTFPSAAKDAESRSS